MSKQDNNKPEIQAMALDAVSDARLMLNKVAELLTKINAGLTIDEKLALREEFESLSYSFMMVLMDAELTKEQETAESGESATLDLGIKEEGE